MKKLLLAALLLFGAIVTLSSSQKAFNMSTTSAKGGYFSMILAANAENTLIQIDWGDGESISYTLGTSQQEITGTIKGEIIQVYGKGISYLNVNSKNLSILDVATASDLTELYCSSNTLSELDVSNLKNLVILNCSSNQIAQLNVKNSRGLVSLFCSSNLLTTLDLSKNPLLEQLYCSSNNIQELDVSVNTQLKVLYCTSNNLKSLILSDNLLLSSLNCSSNKIGKLDVSLNTALTYLWCYSNHLSEIDISNNTQLVNFNCSNNNISQIDVSKNTSLLYFYCNSNKLTFLTLPLRQSSWISYIYSPQQPVEMAKLSYLPGETIDLSSTLPSSISSTVFIWKTSSGSILVSGVDYEEANGIFKFLTIPKEEIFCQMINSSFPNLVLKSEKITISNATQILNTFAPVNLFPNPFREYITIEAPERINRVEFYTLSGKLVLHEKINNNKSATINLSNVLSGVFLVKIYCGTKISVYKIIKE